MNPLIGHNQPTRLNGTQGRLVDIPPPVLINRLLVARRLVPDSRRGAFLGILLTDWMLPIYVIMNR